MAYSITKTLLTTAAFLPAAALAACQWASLRQMTDTYIESQTFGELDPNLQTANIIYKENDQIVDINTGLLSKSLKVDFAHSIIDQTECASFTKLVVADSKNPYVIGTQIFYNDTVDGKLTTDVVDVLVTTGINGVSQILEYVQAEDWSSLGRDNQDSRDVLRAIADGYLDLWSDSSKISSVPFGRGCSRLEGSRFIADSCTAGLGLPEPGTAGAASRGNTNRRYVIDESVGAVSVFSDFSGESEDGAASASHEFRIVGGKLYYVHQIFAAKA